MPKVIPPKKPQDELSIDLSPGSKGVLHLYTNNRITTFFLTDEAAYKLINKSEFPSCFSQDKMRSVNEQTAYHDLAHRVEEPWMNEVQHIHLLKDPERTKDIHPEDIACLLDKIKQYEKKLQICKDGKTNCLITDKDSKRINEEYEAYYSQKLNQTKNLSHYYNYGLSILLRSFFKELLNHYFRPALISQGNFSLQSANWIASLLEILIDLLTSFSVKESLITAVMEKILSPVFKKLDFSSFTSMRIISSVGALLLFKPSDVITLGINGTASTMGQAWAYKVIRSLPKLKDEEVIKPDDYSGIFSK